MPKEPKKPTFEQALAKLEQIVEQIEDGKIGLAESITRYEEGMELIGYCRGVLADAELKIQKLAAAPDGTLEATDMAPPVEGDPGDEQQTDQGA